MPAQTLKSVCHWSHDWAPRTESLNAHPRWPMIQSSIATAIEYQKRR